MKDLRYPFIIFTVVIIILITVFSNDPMDSAVIIESATPTVDVNVVNPEYSRSGFKSLSIYWTGKEKVTMYYVEEYKFNQDTLHFIYPSGHLSLDVSMEIDKNVKMVSIIYPDGKKVIFTNTYPDIVMEEVQGIEE